MASSSTPSDASAAAAHGDTPNSSAVPTPTPSSSAVPSGTPAASHLPPPAPTTISALTDDLLREVFLRLPDLPSLVLAACTCPAFLRAVRSSPAFRRRFRELHTPPILALFIEPDMRAFVPSARHMSDTGITTAFADLLRDDGASEWRSHSETPYSDGYVLFVNRSTEQVVCYNVHSQALEIYPKKMTHDGIVTCLEFHTLLPDQEQEGQRASRVVCVAHGSSWEWARVAVFSSHTMEWQIFPESGTSLLPVGYKCWISMVVSGFVCWLFQDCLLALNTANFQFSRMNLPLSLSGPDSEKSKFNIGPTKDGELCLVGVQECTLFVWFLTVDSDGVERFTLHKTVPLHTSVKEVTKCSVEDIGDVGWQLVILIDGFVYLSLVYGYNDPQSWFLSVCLETAEVIFLFEGTRCSYCFDPYNMAWPPSLIHKKEDSETQVTGKSVGDHGHVGTEEASPVLFTALRSFKEALIDDDKEKLVEIESFLLDDEINSLQNKIATFDAGLAAARDSVLRIGAHSDICRQGTTERESWWRMCKGMLRRARPSCFAS